MGEHIHHNRSADPGTGTVDQLRQASAFSIVITYGLTETMDMALSPTFASRRVTENGVVTDTASGLSDTVLGIAWRWYDDDGLSFAVKPELTLPTGDEARGLGTGEPSWGINNIVTYETGPWFWMANLAYTKARFKDSADAASSRSDIWRLSAGTTYALNDDWRLAAEIGVRTNDTKDDPFLPGRNGSFAMLGTIYLPTESSEVGFGVRRAVSDGEFDWALSLGATWRW